MNTLYLSTAIPFVNARPHLGFALELCIADAYARHARARGKQVRFVTGSDDHSLKNVLAAERAGESTRDFVDRHAAEFRQLSAALEISADRFVQTSRAPAHAPCTYALWNACAERGDLYQETYRGAYCVGCERFVDPGETRCSEHDAPLETVAEHNWFFRASRYRERVRTAIESGALAITHPGAREETLAFLREPLRDLCISRSAARARGWGLPVPNDPSQVIWVWFDALAYYLSALEFGAATSELETCWNAGRRVHVIGKGITRFHAVFWPAILASAGIALPTELRVHGYLTKDGAKISKSGEALDPEPWLRDYGSDAVRYFLLRHVRTGRDGDFTAERFDRAYHAELANGLGNLANRVLGLVARSNASCVPPASATPEVDVLRAASLELPGAIDSAIARTALDDALAAAFDRVDLANRLIDQTAPWAVLRAGDTARANAILRGLLETLRVLATEFAPFLPRVSRELTNALAAPEPSRAWNALTTGAALPAALRLFPRVRPTPL
jgi:methionyl-tRNA synthetase